MKKTAVMLMIGAMVFMLSACGQEKNPGEVQTGTMDNIPQNDTAADDDTVSGVQTGTMDDIPQNDTAADDDTVSGVQTGTMDDIPQNDTAADDDTVSGVQTGTMDNIPQNDKEADEMTAEELFDLFINGSISAVDSTDPASTFYITDLKMDSEEWDSYSIGERVDLDNDGEDELIICGPYGGIYLDARDNKVYEFAAGEGTGYMLSYVVYNGATWIMYSDRMHTGYEAYYMEKFEGADYLAAEIEFHEERVDEDNAEGEEKYTWNGTELSYEEYFDLCSKIFATEVFTN